MVRKGTKKASELAGSALDLFRTAYAKLQKADELLEQENEMIKAELEDLELAKYENASQLERNARVKENLKQFLPDIQDDA